MIVLKIATVFLLVLVVGADKKIELQDIEEDNLRSEKEKKNVVRQPFTTASTIRTSPVQLDLLKNEIGDYYDGHTPGPQQVRFVQQYAVTEPPEIPDPIPNPQYAAPHSAQYGFKRPLLGYLSNFPFQIFVVPQYYHSASMQHLTEPTKGPSFTPDSTSVQSQTEYVDQTSPDGTSEHAYLPPYMASGPYSSPPSPIRTPIPSQLNPATAYNLPIIQYTTETAQQQQLQQGHKTFYHEPQYSDDARNPENIHYDSANLVAYNKPQHVEYPRHYNARTPIKENYRPPYANVVKEIPYPNPVTWKEIPPHLAHLPKALPMYRPKVNAPYQGGSHGPALFKRRPTSLLDSYIPSTVQVEYLKRGIVSEPGAVYDAIASGRLPHPIPQQYERGFLPNRMFTTALGGITYGHYKRTPKDKGPY